MNIENEIEQNSISAGEKARSTAWLIRCSPDQKDFFQRVASESGKNAADFILTAIENYKIKSNIQENSKAQKELEEAEFLIDRLTSLIRSKILILSEKEIQLDADMDGINKLKNNLEEDFEKKEKTIQFDFEKRYAEITNEFNKKELELAQNIIEDKKRADASYSELKHNFEELETKFQQKITEAQIYQRQVSDSMKLYESVEERNTELKKSLDKLEKENIDLKKSSEKSFQLDKMVDELTHKLEIMKMTYEQEIKRLHSEHELKIKIKEQEVENKYRTS